MKKRDLVLILTIMLILFSSFVSARTTCETKGCDIIITLNISFAGATNAQIINWANEISNVWNGNGQKYGQCKCNVKFKVNAKSVNSCTPKPAGYHCVDVLPWNGTDESLPALPAGPRAGERVTGYMGKTTQSPSVGGASIDGEWSDQMSRPVNPNNPQAGNYKDAAHEAGHMMGLNDGEGGIMNFTSGANAAPTQANIDNVVNRMCGQNACPDRCCCGNGQIDRNKGEQCDPFAVPDGCSQQESCCPICCSCAPFGQECDHIRTVDLSPFIEAYNSEVKNNPTIAKIFANQKINLYIEGAEEYSMITSDLGIEQAEQGFLEDPTMNVFSDVETFEDISIGDLGFMEALDQGRVTYEGVGFVNSIKYGALNLIYSIYSFFAGEEEILPEEPVPSDCPLVLPEEII
ncbi:hypothetical protein KY343_03280 [Candidatus Woesearchaeota archaeon]|nr:hypothetical protein [Candidatus Woesearchaeota archaeon]